MERTNTKQLIEGMVDLMVTDQLKAPEALKMVHKQLGGTPGKGDSRRYAYHLSSTEYFAEYQKLFLEKVKVLIALDDLRYQDVSMASKLEQVLHDALRRINQGQRQNLDLDLQILRRREAQSFK